MPWPPPWADPHICSVAHPHICSLENLLNCAVADADADVNQERGVREKAGFIKTVTII